jgi:hypothetical protein
MKLPRRKFLYLAAGAAPLPAASRIAMGRGLSVAGGSAATSPLGPGDQTELAQARFEVERLRLIIQRLQRSQFGRRSERIDGDQLALGLEDLDADIARAQAGHPADSESNAGSEHKLRRQGLPGHLTREDVAIDVDGEVLGGLHHQYCKI